MEEKNWVIEKPVEEKIEKRIKRLFKFYFDENKIGIISLGITDFKVFISKDNDDEAYIIFITLERPGLFIGKKGSEIDNIQKYLKLIFNKNVFFKIIESTLWDI